MTKHTNSVANRFSEELRLMVNTPQWIKAVLVGSGGVGKTCIIYRLVTGQFVTTTMTRGMDAQAWSIQDHQNTVKYNLLLFDLGGQEQFRTFHPAFMQGARVCLAVFDLSRYASLLELEEWIPLIEPIPASQRVLVGNKADLACEVSEAEVIRASEKWEMSYVQVSAKTGANFDQLELSILKMLKAI